MDFVSAIFKTFKTGYNMLRSLFRKYELKDESMMKLELKQADLVNDATAIRLVICIRNHGLTALKVNAIRPKISIEGYIFHTNAILCNAEIEPENHQGIQTDLIIPTPYLTAKHTLQNLGRALERDLFKDDVSITAAVEELEINITRGLSSHTSKQYLNGRTDWRFNLSGLHFFIKNVA